MCCVYFSFSTFTEKEKSSHRRRFEAMWARWGNSELLVVVWMPWERSPCKLVLPDPGNTPCGAPLAESDLTGVNSEWPIWGQGEWGSWVVNLATHLHYPVKPRPLPTREHGHTESRWLWKQIRWVYYLSVFKVHFCVSVFPAGVRVESKSCFRSRPIQQATFFFS